jgi:hypothetical protein
VHFTHDGLSLWYGTPDAPAPFDQEVVPRDAASVVVAVHPANPTNSVLVRYRVDGGMVQAMPGRELRTDFAREVQYFVARFPPLPGGQVVEFAPSVSCGGRQAPPAALGQRFPSRFRLATPAPRVSAVQTARPAALPGRFEPGLQFVAKVAVTFDPPQFLGETPAGVRVNFLVREGTVEGPGFRARVTVGSSDQMIVRRDGMGVIRIRAAFATEDGAMLDVESGGYVDFGEDGYRQAQAGRLRDRSPLVVSPLLSTRHPKYDWLSRIQCVGHGHTRLDSYRASYCVYAVLPKMPAG